MKTILITIAVLILAATYACAATKTLTVEYTHEDLADIHHASVYADGMKACESPDNLGTFSCDGVMLRPGWRTFTLTVSADAANEIESAHSDPVTALVVPGKAVILRFEVK